MLARMRAHARKRYVTAYMRTLLLSTYAARARVEASCAAWRSAAQRMREPLHGSHAARLHALYYGYELRTYYATMLRRLRYARPPLIFDAAS